jgi:hypothetical protein
MKKIIGTLSVIILLTSACAKNSNQMDSNSNFSSNNAVGKLSANNLTGSYTVEKFTAKTIDGDFVVTFPGLVETREILNQNGSLVIKQKSSLNGCTRETVSPLDISIEAGIYTRGHFVSEHCDGSCPAKVTGNFQGYQVQDPSFDLACGKNEDHAESGKVSIENDRLLFELTDDYSLVEQLIKTK